MNSLWLDYKYCNLLSFRLDKFKRKSEKQYQFRCPLCMDSTTNKFKTRGNIFEYQGKLLFHCYNCGASKSFKMFLKHLYPDLYDEYMLDTIKERHKNPPEKFVAQIESFGLRRMDKFEPLKDLKKISQLEYDHHARKYCDERKIPLEQHFRLYYAPKFYKWVNGYIPGKFKEKQLADDEPRLVVPFIDSRGYVFGATGRSFKKDSIRYIMVKFDEDHPKIFGLDTVDFNLKTYIFEGPIDSLFISNSLAFGGSTGDLRGLPLTDDSVIVMDNEPRGKDIVRVTNSLIDNGYNVCVWPSDIEYKDVNEMIVAGWSVDQVKNIIDTHQYKGLAAKMALQKWKKI